MKNIYPLFVVNDIGKVSDYLKVKFQFGVVFESDWYIQLAYQESQVGLMAANSKNQPDFLHPGFNGEGVVLTIEVENVDVVYRKFDEGEIIHELTTEEWGQRHFIIMTPGKLIIDVVNYSEPEDYK